MKLSKVAYAVMGLTATMACTIAVAGNFQPNTTSIAREVIVGDNQAVIAPQASYSFVGPVRNPINATNFQIQLELSDGEWVPGATTAGFAGATGNVALVDSLGNVIANAWGALLDPTNKKRLYATFQIAPGVTVSGAFVTWNASGAVGFAAAAPAAADKLQIKKLKSLVGGLAIKADGTCDQDIKNLTGEVFQYPNITDPTFIATDLNAGSPASEHKLPGAQNKGPVISLPVNLLVFGAANPLLATQDYNLGAKKFVVGANTTLTGLTANIGTATYKKISNGYDADLANVYGVPPATVVVAAVGIVGAPELKSYSATITGNFAATAKLWLSGVACIDAGYATGIAPTAGSVTLTDVVAADLAINTPINVCYGVDGTSAIPTTNLPAALALNKAPDGLGDVAARKEEQPNFCKANFAVGSGIQVDVRNYASFASYGTTGGAQSIVRVINNSETSTADVWAQMIYADGTYGAYGQLGSLKPREVLAMTNKALEEKINLAATASAPTDPFGIGATNYTRQASASVVAGPKPGVGDRVRIVSTTGTTIRVQSFMVVNLGNGQTILDTSQAQGVDFENNAAGRVPTNQNDAQPISQDAVKGLAR